MIKSKTDFQPHHELWIKQFVHFQNFKAANAIYTYAQSNQFNCEKVKLGLCYVLFNISIESTSQN